MTISKVGLLVTSNQLREKLSHILWHKRLDTKIRVLDASYDFDKQDDGYKEFYLNGHIPSSVYFNHRQYTESTPFIPFNLPDTNCFTDYVQSLGVSSDTHIITYDRMDMRAALRAWWMFRLHGHNNISVLDGGLKKWVRDGHPVTTEEPTVERGNFKARVDQSLMRDFNSMRENVKSKKEQVIDARGSGSFNDVVKTDSGDQKANLPGAVNIPYATVFNEDGTFKSVENLQNVFKAASVDFRKPLVAMCQRGITACALAAAAEILGKPNTPIYYGSWYEYSRKIAQ